MSDQKPPQKPFLPHGWIVKQSKTYPDRVYYFNTITAQSTWERPELTEQASSVPRQPKEKQAPSRLDQILNVADAELTRSLRQQQQTQAGFLQDLSRCWSRGSTREENESQETLQKSTSPVEKHHTFARSSRSSVSDRTKIPRRGSKWKNTFCELSQGSFKDTNESRDPSSKPLHSSGTSGNSASKDRLHEGMASCSSIAQISKASETSSKEYSSQLKAKLKKESNSDLKMGKSLKRSLSPPKESKNVKCFDEHKDIKSSKKLKTETRTSQTKMTPVGDESLADFSASQENAMKASEESDAARLEGNFDKRMGEDGSSWQSCIKDMMSGMKVKKKKKKKTRKSDNIPDKALQNVSGQSETEQIVNISIRSGSPVVNPLTGLLDLPELPRLNTTKAVSRKSLVESWIKKAAIQQTSPVESMPAGSSGTESGTAAMDVDSGDWDSLVRTAVASSLSSESERITNLPQSETPVGTEDVEMTVEDAEKLNYDIHEIRESLSGQLYQPVGNLTKQFNNHDMGHHSSHPVSKVYVVLDTNVLIHHLKIIDEIKDTQFSGIGKPVLVIPWVVMQELDRLKDGKTKHKNDDDIRHKAMKPVTFLHNSFLAKHPRVLGQTPKQAKERLPDFEIECSDDRILQCCFQLKKKYPNADIVLYSNDKNLCSKAMISGVNACSKEEIITFLKRASKPKPKPTDQMRYTSTDQVPCHSVSQNQDDSGSAIAFTSQVPYTSASQLPYNGSAISFHELQEASSPKDSRIVQHCHSKTFQLNEMFHSGAATGASNPAEKFRPCTPPEGRRIVVPSGSDRESQSMVNSQSQTLQNQESHQKSADDFRCELKAVLKEGLSAVIETEMKAVYEDLWVNIVIAKPPWTFSDVMECFKKHWIAVFGMVYPRYLEEEFSNLREQLLSMNVDLTSIRSAVASGLTICRRLQEHSDYNGEISKMSDHLERIEGELLPEAKKQPGTNVTSTHPNVNESTILKHVQDKFQVVWENILNYCVNIVKTLQKPPDAMVTSDVASRQEVVSFMQKFCPLVMQLGEAFDNFLGITLDDTTSLQLHAENMCHILNNFASALGMNWDTVPAISTQDICLFYMNKETRQALHNGSEQLKLWLEDTKPALQNLTSEERLLIFGSHQPP